ncbi:S1 family peptidase [Eisenibacter elegans]|jgi:S1-C subfamily serine protease|uniref:S1 family peptidase n=1 Tax=Eisenibacter elegans TaxID=997 RepID=UPI00041E8390|nr:serine protease [Eisenibacter elegans]
MKSEGNLPLIEQYLQGQMSADQCQQFEKQMAEDAHLAQEVAQYGQLLQRLRQHESHLMLKRKLQVFQQELESENISTALEAPALPKHRGRSVALRPLWDNSVALFRRNASMLAVAASVALLTSIVTVIVLKHDVRYLAQRQSNNFEAYKDLKRDLDAVKRSQQSLADRQKKNEQMLLQPPTSGATAFVLASNGYLVTNYHVVKDADAIYIASASDTLDNLKVVVVHTDPTNDLAILRVIEEGFQTFGLLPFGIRAEEADLGEPVFTLAYPRQEMVYGEGSISARSGYQGDTTAYQISVPVNPGNSGGPLLDMKGNLIGIVKGKNTRMEGTAFAVKVKYLLQMLDAIQAQNPEQLIVLPKQGQMHTLDRTNQIKVMQNFVFDVKVYKSSEQ